MKREAILISTIAEDAAQTAEQYGLGLELAEFCTASNLDDDFAQTDCTVKKQMAHANRFVLHGPFSELFPCAVDPKARDLARLRYRQIFAVAQAYGISKVVLHAGFQPHLYFPCWFTQQSIVFWKAFVPEIPHGMTICLENTLEETPDMLMEIFRAVESPKLRMCLDVGHVNAYAHTPVSQWLTACGPYISHFHLHNNDGRQDAHNAVFQGTVDMEQVLDMAQTLCPSATVTLEVRQAEPSVRWLLEKGWIL